jgi:hypothetical protein
MPRKTLKDKQEKQQKLQQNKAVKNRVLPLVESINGTEDPDDLMQELMGLLSESSTAPQVGKYYTFVYSTKTSGITYDEYPLVAVTEVLKWGFKGFNFHWNDGRQYTWKEIIGGVYNILDEEITDVRKIPFGKIRSK